ncbi:MAG: ABC transporter ATP-binding protein [Candidatus Omnitrophica bacterium]|nr:ABC transporter ATP-binding protein [Candidatus Omnitrophota bacterium]MBU1925376.1 ABC transporter ATP-binding protein [Candidatus Omnitrophota bacterium]
MSKNAIDLKCISKKYSLDVTRRSVTKNLLSCLKGILRKEEVWALNDINFSVKQGETVGIIGENASGKTTILRIISGITTPTKGEVKVGGKVAGILDLGAGFFPELTGAENVYLNASLFGMNKKEIEAVYDDIVKFSGLDRFIDAQVKTYSQGMLLRLGFSVAIHVKPDIFLIDDTMAVGDEEFQRKCYHKIEQLKKTGVTIIIVSHDLESLSRICDRGLLLKSGRLIKDDSMQKIIVRYVEAVGDKQSVACIDKGRLSLIFNNGKIVILWDGRPLTKNFGGYLSLKTTEELIMSWRADWQVYEADSEHFRVEGIVAKINARIIFEVYAEGERRFKWQVTVDMPHAANIKQLVCGLMVSEDYGRFLNEQVIEELRNAYDAPAKWQVLYRTNETNAPLVLLGKDKLPIIAAHFNMTEAKGVRLIQHTDKNLDACVMQIQLDLPKNSLASGDSRVAVFCRANIELLKEDDFRTVLKHEKEKRTLNANGLNIEIKKDRIHIFYKHAELTKNQGFKFGFNRGGYFINIFEGAWEAQRTEIGELMVNSNFENLSVKLRLSLQADPQALNWKMSVEYSNGQGPIGLSANLFLSEKFRKFYDFGQELEFLNFTEHTEQVMLNRPNTDFICLSTDDNDSPAVIFIAQDDSRIELQNTDFYESARVLIARSFQTNSCSGKLILCKTNEEKEDFINAYQGALMADNILSNNKLSMELRRNAIRVCSDGIEITEMEGFKSSIFSEGRWHESVPIIKEFKKNGNEFKICIKRKKPHLNEFWLFKLEEDTIHWTVKLECFDELAGSDYKFGMILKSDFTQWEDSFRCGKFVEYKNTPYTIRGVGLDDILFAVKKEDDYSDVVLFETNDNNIEGIMAQCQKSGHVVESKVQLSSLAEKDLGKMTKIISGNIKFLKRDSWAKHIDKYRLSNFTILPKKDLQLFVAPSQVRLLWRNTKITCDDGLRVAFSNDEGKSESQNNVWQIKKICQNKIDVELYRDVFPVVQKWSFESRDNAIVWEVTFKVEKCFIIKEMLIDVRLIALFNSWFTEKECGKVNFETDIDKGAVFFDHRGSFVGANMDRICYEQPAVIFNLLGDSKDWSLNIFKHYKRKDMVGYGVKRIIRQDGLVLDKGSHDIFSAKIILTADKKEPILPKGIFT